MNRFDAACRLLAAAIVGLLALASGGWLDRSGTLSPTMIRPWGGQAYLLAPIGAAFPGPRWLGVFYDEKGDSKSPAAADIRFFEDGLPLGPAHSLHADIAAKGGGRYSHWRGYLVFSASDNSDPRSNGRRYTLIMPAVPWRIALLPALLLAGLVGWRQRHGAADGLPEIRLALSAGKRVGSLKALPLMLAAIVAALAGGMLFAPIPTASLEWAIALGLILLTTRLAGGRGLSPRQADALAFAIPAAVGLGVFASVTLAHPMPLRYTPDSFGYLDPALRMLAGEPVEGFSLRGIGYPALIAAVLYFSTLRSLPIVQLGLMIVTLASLCIVLFLFLQSVLDSWSAARRPISRPIRSYAMAAVGLGFILVVVSHDGFVIELYELMAEAPHIAVTAVALLLFTFSWLVYGTRPRLFLALAAVVAAAVSVLVKPMTLFALGLAAASLVWTAWVARRKLRVIDLCIVISVLCVIGVAYYGDHLTESKWAKYFGPQTLVCFHIPIILEPLGEATPARAELASLLRAVLADGPQGYETLGFNGDRCMYNNSIDKAIQRAADTEHAGRGSWLMKLFIAGVVRNPIVYINIVGRQIVRYLNEPVELITLQAVTSINDSEWHLVEPYSRQFDIERPDFSAHLENWIIHDLPELGSIGKRILSLISAVGKIILPLSIIVAAMAAAMRRPRRPGKAEVIVLCIGCFTLSYILLIAAAHTFDVGRYSVGVAPLTLLWFAVAAIYLIYVGLLGVTWFRRRVGSVAPAAAGKVATPVSSVIEGDPPAGAIEI